MSNEHRIENNGAASRICIVTVKGNIALDGVKELKAYMHPFIDDEVITGIAIDIANVKFIDSSGIALLVTLFKKLKE